MARNCKKSDSSLNFTT